MWKLILFVLSTIVVSILGHLRISVYSNLDPVITEVKCQVEEGKWTCARNKNTQYHYYCEDKFLYINSEKFEKFCNLLEDPTDVERKFYWNCPAFEIHDLMKDRDNCFFAGAIKSD